MPPGDAIININKLSRRFKKVEALRGIDLEIKKAELFGIVGPDASGKTTLIQSMCAILDPTEGSIKVDGFDTVKDSSKITSRIGYMSQAYSLYEDLTAGENLEFFAKIRKGTTVFVTTHYLREVEGCSRVAFLHQGRIMALDTPNRLKAIYNKDSLDDVFVRLMEGTS